MNNKRNFWGWGYADFKLSQEHLDRYLPFLMNSFGLSEEGVIPIPQVDSVSIPGPGFSLDTGMDIFCTDDKYERLSHCYGKSFRDVWRGLHNRWDRPPDYVAFPADEDQIRMLMDFSASRNIALIPYGGGSSVCGGVESPRSPGYEGAISVDMKYFDKVLEIDHASRSALVEGGIYGPALEKVLKPHGLTLRHYPQSFEFSTLGGWIATRSGGHFATLYTHIDEFVQSVRMVTPAGVIQTRKLPAHGAGPSEERFISGSEGSLGIITSAWVRLQHIPKFKLTATIHFKTFYEGVEACRKISQSGLYPSNARLVDAMEAFSNGLGDGQSSVLIIGFEGHNHSVEPLMEVAKRIALDCGGLLRESSPHLHPNKTGADQWKKAFLLAPYLRDELIRRGIIVETFETAITWDKFQNFHEEIIQTAQNAIKKVAGTGFITTRFTHLYPDGPAPYYTIIAKGRKNQQLDQWDAIKDIISRRIIELGGPITHHHAVGKDHKRYYDDQRSFLFGEILKSAKKTLDPKGIMNPETLIG